jgi:hypothetical protein
MEGACVPLTATTAPLAMLTASDMPGAAAAGLLDETAAAVLYEDGGFILLENGS